MTFIERDIEALRQHMKMNDRHIAEINWALLGTSVSPGPRIDTNELRLRAENIELQKLISALEGSINSKAARGSR